MHEETHDRLFAAGWVGVLARWKRDPNLLVTLPATKALCNMDQVGRRLSKLRNMPQAYKTHIFSLVKWNGILRLFR